MFSPYIVCLFHGILLLQCQPCFSADDNSSDSTEKKSISWAQMGTSALTTIGIGAAILCGYTIARRFVWEFYTPRSLELDDQGAVAKKSLSVSKAARSGLPARPLRASGGPPPLEDQDSAACGCGWLRVATKMPTIAVLKAVGLDAYMLLAFSRAAAVLFCVPLLVLAAIMAAVNFYVGTNADAGTIEEFDRIGLANIANEDNILYVHAFVMWLITLAVCGVLLNVGAQYVRLRHLYLQYGWYHRTTARATGPLAATAMSYAAATPTSVLKSEVSGGAVRSNRAAAGDPPAPWEAEPHAYSIMVRNLPAHIHCDAQLQEWAATLFGKHEIASVSLVTRAQTLEEQTQAREDAILALAKVQYLHDSEVRNERLTERRWAATKDRKCCRGSKPRSVQVREADSHVEKADAEYKLDVIRWPAVLEKPCYLLCCCSTIAPEMCIGKYNSCCAWMDDGGTSDEAQRLATDPDIWKRVVGPDAADFDGPAGPRSELAPVHRHLIATGTANPPSALRKMVPSWLQAKRYPAEAYLWKEYVESDEKVTAERRKASVQIRKRQSEEPEPTNQSALDRLSAAPAAMLQGIGAVAGGIAGMFGGSSHSQGFLPCNTGFITFTTVTAAQYAARSTLTRAFVTQEGAFKGIPKDVQPFDETMPGASPGPAGSDEQRSLSPTHGTRHRGTVVERGPSAPPPTMSPLGDVVAAPRPSAVTVETPIRHASERSRYTQRVLRSGGCCMLLRTVKDALVMPFTAAGGLNKLSEHPPVDVQMAPHVDDIAWESLHASEREISSRRTVTLAITIGVTIVFTAFVTAVAALASIERLADAIPFLDFILDLPEAVQGLLANLIPAVILAVAMDMLLGLFHALSKAECIPTQSGIELSTAKRFIWFTVYQVFIVLIVAGTIWGALSQLIDSPLKVIEILAENVPRLASFYITYVLVRGCIKTPMDLLNPVAAVLFWLKFKRPGTARAHELAHFQTKRPWATRPIFSAGIFSPGMSDTQSRPAAASGSQTPTPEQALTTPIAFADESPPGDRAGRVANAGAAQAASQHKDADGTSPPGTPSTGGDPAGPGERPRRAMHTYELWGVPRRVWWESVLKSKPFNYVRNLADITLAFLIGVTFCVIHPLIVPAVGIYFLSVTTVWKWSLLYIHPKTWESGGRLWPILSLRITAALILAQLTVIGLLNLKDATGPSGIVIATVPFTVLVGWFLHRKLEKPADQLAVEETRATDAAFKKAGYSSRPTRAVEGVPESVLQAYEEGEWPTPVPTDSGSATAGPAAAGVPSGDMTGGTAQSSGTPPADALARDQTGPRPAKQVSVRGTREGGRDSELDVDRVLYNREYAHLRTHKDCAYVRPAILRANDLKLTGGAVRRGGFLYY